MSSPTFLLFSGHNDRAVVTLCRFFTGAGIPFAIAASGRDDAIHRTAYRDAVIVDRLDKSVSVDWLAALVESAGRPLVYCPTTEFLNDFMLAHRAEVESAGWILGLPARAAYEQLTGKFASREIVARLIGVQAPGTQAMDDLRAPCVLKPRVNVVEGRVLYPVICPDDAALRRAQAGLKADDWFAQDYVDGQSRYLCGYLAADGRRAWFWQDNLLQQPGGKSIVLARTGRGPAVDAGRFFDGLAELGYRGPLMMEVIEDAGGRLHYIEINPRFWGPLQLALIACPRILELFAEDHGAKDVRWPAHADAGLQGVGALPADSTPGNAHYYAWSHGGQSPQCRRYPAADSLGGPAELARALDQYDIYAAPDTIALHGSH